MELTEVRNRDDFAVFYQEHEFLDAAIYKKYELLKEQTGAKGTRGCGADYASALFFLEESVINDMWEPLN